MVKGYDNWYYHLQVTMSGWKVFIAGNDAATCLSSVLMVVPLHIFAWRLGCPLSSDTETETRSHVGKRPWPFRLILVG